jgi:hypothetical protein
MAALRARRAELQAAEDDHSLLRRIVQTRLDLVRAERARRAFGQSSGVDRMVDDLPTTLAGPAGGGAARPPRGLAGRLPPQLVDEVDRICDVDVLHRLPDLDDDSLDALADGLLELERVTSEQRQALHRELDELAAELARRYASGQASVDDLLEG